MKKISMLTAGLLVFAAGAWCQKPPLLPEKDVAAIAGEINGTTAKRNLEGIAQYHRQRGSRGFRAAAELVAGKLREYGLNDVAILQFPADGKIFYGTQRSRPAWDAEFAELSWKPGDQSDCDNAKIDKEKGVFIKDCVSYLFKIANFAVEPVGLAEDSESADVTTDLADVGAGTKESDYAGKDVKGKIVLVSAQPGAVQDLAVGKYGAVGIVSYAQNQKTAWWGENLDAVRWGHLEAFSANKTFAFMVSLRTAHALQEQLAKGEEILLHAVVKAGQHPGSYEVVTATIPGADEKLKNEEIAFSCHLDHQRPGANDNASGCATILEVARTLQKLIGENKLARPARTIRFIFPPEIEGTMALLNAKAPSFMLPEIEDKRTGIYTPALPAPPPAGSASTISGPELAKRIKAVVHMDMVGGGPETKTVFHVTRGPMSLPSFVQDVAWAFAEWVNEETYQYAATGKAAHPLVEAEGGKEPLRAEYSAYTMGSDHDVYQDSSFGIPAIYLNDWPDRFIHTNLDAPANIDATKLKRVGLIGAAGGYLLSNLANKEFPAVKDVMEVGNNWRNSSLGRRGSALSSAEASCAEHYELENENQRLNQLERFLGTKEEYLLMDGPECPLDRAAGNSGADQRFWRRQEPKGPMAVFGYNYFAAEWTKRGHTTKPKLLEYEGLWGSGEEYAYEVLNFADGKRNMQEIRDAVSAEYGPVPLEVVVEYLKALEEIGVMEKVEAKK